MSPFRRLVCPRRIRFHRNTAARWAVRQALFRVPESIPTSPRTLSPTHFPRPAPLLRAPWQPRRQPAAAPSHAPSRVRAVPPSRRSAAWRHGSLAPGGLDSRTRPARPDSLSLEEGARAALGLQCGPGSAPRPGRASRPRLGRLGFDSDVSTRMTRRGARTVPRMWRRHLGCDRGAAAVLWQHSANQS